MRFDELASDLLLAEGPVALADGSLLVCEVLAGRVTRIGPDGQREVVATLGGGANGAALGPDGRCYVCNNGGLTAEELSLLRTGSELPDPGEPRGRIDAIDLATGTFETIHASCGGAGLIAPNDLVFDADGGFYFSDFGPLTTLRSRPGHLYYASCDGRSIRHVAGPLVRPNGVGLSPDGTTLYTAETTTGRVWSFAILSPGHPATRATVGCGGRLLLDDPELQLDSLAVESTGHVCVAAPGNDLIVRLAPDGSTVERIATPEGRPTNLCFGGPGLRTAYVTFVSGKLLATRWPHAGLRLHFSR